MDNDRLKHSYVVAKKMMEIAMKYNLSEEEVKNCFLIGLNHDIGYEFTTNGVINNWHHFNGASIENAMILKKIVDNCNIYSI